MTVYIGADHGGFLAKERLKRQLAEAGYVVEDCGASQLDTEDDYPEFGAAVGRAVAAEPGSRGIALCRSGHGMVIAANKIHGVRAVLAVNEESVVQSREHDDANVLAFGVDFIGADEILPLSLAWLRAAFEGGRHERRVEEIEELERRSE